MLQDVVDPREHISMESPIAAHLLDFADDAADLFLAASDVSSSGTGGNNNCSATTGGANCSPFVDDAFSMDPSALSSLLDPHPPPDLEPGDLLAAVNYHFPPPPPPRDHELDQMVQLAADSGAYSSAGMMPAEAYEDDCLLGPQPATYVGGLEPSASCSFFDATGLYHPAAAGMGIPAVYGGAYSSAGMVGPEMGEYPSGVGMGVYGMDLLQNGYASGELQVLGERQQQLMGNCSNPTPLTSDMSALDESTFKVGRLSVEERKEKIHRYMKKRNERNFSKKIKYACRKTLADSRPRVRGRFAKNEEFGETTRPSSSNNEYDEDDEVAVKEEDLFDSTDILAHISGVNSFKYNCTLESWI